MTQTPKRPVLIDLDDAPSPAEAPPVPDLDVPTPRGQAMQTMATLAARRPSWLARWFWGVLVGLIGFVASVAAYDFVTTLIARNAVLGYAALGLTGLFVLLCLTIIVRELAAFARLSRLDEIQKAAEAALVEDDLTAARHVTDRLTRLYAGREDTRWGREALREHQSDAFDAQTLLGAAEREVLGPLDTVAKREVEAAARQVATVTALVPLALADVVAALTANLRMIRRIAEVYGGRTGTLGNWRLTRTVMTHLVATGAVAIGDDLIGSVAGGGVLARVSRRFGEGLVNGALTARVGVAAMEVCRPLPFTALPRPSVTTLVKRSLTGLFDRSDKE